MQELVEYLAKGLVDNPDEVRVERVEKDGGSTALVRTTFVLRCLTSPCVPPYSSTTMAICVC